MSPSEAQGALDDEIRRISTVTEMSATKVRLHNSNVAESIRTAVEGRKRRVMERRKLAGAPGFPVTRRKDGPRPVPLRRKQVNVRPHRQTERRGEYRDEFELMSADYEEVVRVISFTLLAMERTPSVVINKREEHLRDLLLIQLNGTFEGAATGETFVRSGKTDILVTVDGRHVFVGECKKWHGPSQCHTDMDQLLSYLPWRNGGNFVLGHPDDRDREIHLAALFAVIRKD